MNATRLYGRVADTLTAKTHRVRRHTVGKGGCSAKPPRHARHAHFKFIEIGRIWDFGSNLASIDPNQALKT